MTLFKNLSKYFGNTNNIQQEFTQKNTGIYPESITIQNYKNDANQYTSNLNQNFNNKKEENFNQSNNFNINNYLPLIMALKNGNFEDVFKTNPNFALIKEFLPKSKPKQIESETFKICQITDNDLFELVNVNEYYK